MKILSNNLWKKHPWNQGNLVEEVSTKFLAKICDFDTPDITDDLDNQNKNQEEVFSNIEKHGMRDPLLIVISQKHKTIRLESGNHRIRVALERGYTHLPVATLIIEEKLLKEGNGLHTFCASELVDFSKLIPNPYPYQMKLYDISLNAEAKKVIFNQ